jgi:hypothetical protein
MKRILAAVLAIMMIVGCTLTMASCSALSIFDPKPQTDVEKAKENLEEKDYFVYIDDGKSDDENEPSTLDVGVESILYAFDYNELLEVYNEMTGEDEEAEELDIKALIEKLEEEYGEEFEESVYMSFRMNNIEPALTIVTFEDKKLAGYAYDMRKLNEEREDALEKAAEKDAKKHGETYNADQVYDKYGEKIDKKEYEHAKYMLEEFERDLDTKERAAEKKRYEEIVDAYENGEEDDILYGKKGTAFWYGTKQAIKDSK